MLCMNLAVIGTTLNSFYARCPFILFFKIFYLFIFREEKGGRKRVRETSTCGCLSCAPLLGTWPATQACALTGNRTDDPVVDRPALNPFSHTSQGYARCPFIMELFSYTCHSIICLRKYSLCHWASNKNVVYANGPQSLTKMVILKTSRKQDRMHRTKEKEGKLKALRH